MPEKYEQLMKLIVVGDSGTGKSSLLHRFVEDTFSEERAQTIGVEFGSKIIELSGRRVKLQIWDTAGQERYKSVTRSYYRGAVGCLIVYDITERSSYESVPQWLSDVRQLAGPDVVVMLVGNKSDMAKSRVVLHNEVSLFALENKLLHFETSASTGEFVSDAFFRVAKAGFNLVTDDINGENCREENLNDIPLYRMSKKRSFVLGRGRSRGSESWTVENLAERIFVWSPRLFSFSHRVLSSIRHPYLAVVSDMVDYDGHKKNSRVEMLLGALTESRDEEKKWTRIALMFDSMLTADVMDKLRRKVSLNVDVMMRIEVLWNNLGGVSHGVVKEDEYKSFHYKLYSYLLKIDDVSVITSTSTAISEDFTYDEKTNSGVTFEFFAISMLELADNWTRTRDTQDFVNFLTDINVRCLKTRREPVSRSIPPFCKKTTYFSGGIIRKVVEGDAVTFVKAKQV